MMVATVKHVASYIDRINQVLGLSMEFKYGIEDKGKFPIRRKGNYVVIVPTFFEDKGLSESQRKMIITFIYSVIYLGRTRKIYPIDPECLAKGICDALGEQYIPLYKIEETLRAVRIRMYDEPEYASFFSVGDIIRENCCSKYRILDIKRECATIYIVAEPIGYNAKFSKEPIMFKEAELFEMCTRHKDYSNLEVDLRKNLIIFSAPSVTEKNMIYNALKSRIPEIKRAVTVTTRKQHARETDGVDYYFCTEKDFKEKSSRGEFVEYNLYDNDYYATPYSEIDRYSQSTPLFLVVDTYGMMTIMKKYPLAMSVFWVSPSMRELERKIMECGDNTPEKIKQRIKEANQEMKNAEYYDYIAKSVSIEDCVDELEAIIRKRLNENSIL